MKKWFFLFFASGSLLASSFFSAGSQSVVETFSGHIRDFGNTTIVLDESANIAKTINSLVIRSNSGGTVTASLQICPNGTGCTNVTGCASISVTSTAQTKTCTASNSLGVGGRLQFVLASVSSMTDLYFTAKATQ